MPAVKTLSLAEKQYLLYVERGDVSSVRRELERTKEDKHIDINCVDPLGRSALAIAIENENMALMKLLLSFLVELKDALLIAINEEYVEAVEVLLEHEKQTRPPYLPHSWEVVDRDVAKFTPDMTPLILAAHKNNYEILKLLLDEGFSLPSPHHVKCGCQECVTLRQDDSLRHSRSRINAYTALVSSALIALTSQDPILTAFELSKELKQLSCMETEFKMEYLQLKNQVEEFATNLVNYVRTSKELVIILNYDPEEVEDTDGEGMRLSRLKMAIAYQQKQFVSHPNVQQFLGAVWYEGMPGFRQKLIFGQIKAVVIIGLLFPIHTLLYIFAPFTPYGQRIRKPFIKFINHSTSYCIFLLLLVLVSQRFENVVQELLSQNDLPENSINRGALPSYVEMLIIIYVLGFIWSEIKQLINEGTSGYLKDMWNIVDFITNSLYLMWMGLRLSSWITVQREVAKGLRPYKPREQWDAYDPMLISEGIFGAANIFSFLKMVRIFSVSPQLGPLQISLGRMVFDIIKFFFIYSLVLFAFGCGMNQLLWYYADMDRAKCYNLPNSTLPNPDEEHSCSTWRQFSNLFETSQTLFWASFGLIDLKNFELTGIKEYARFWALLMFGSYSVVNIVVLLNLLIAMMGNSYQLISERSDTEWKFTRSQLWVSYFDYGDTLPPPFNIIPTPKDFKKLLCFARRKSRHSIIIRKEQDRDRKYQSVMSKLVYRYIINEQQKPGHHSVTEDDINEVKQDISTFRYELIDILQNNGFDSSLTTKPLSKSFIITSNARKDDRVIQDEKNLVTVLNTGKKERFKERRLMKGFDIGATTDGFISKPWHNKAKAQEKRSSLLMPRFRRVKKWTFWKKWNIVTDSTTLLNSIHSRGSEESLKKCTTITCDRIHDFTNHGQDSNFYKAATRASISSREKADFTKNQDSYVNTTHSFGTKLLDLKEILRGNRVE